MGYYQPALYEILKIAQEGTDEDRRQIIDIAKIIVSKRSGGVQ